METEVDERFISEIERITKLDDRAEDRFVARTADGRTFALSRFAAMVLKALDQGPMTLLQVTTALSASINGSEYSGEKIVKLVETVLQPRGLVKKAEKPSNQVPKPSAINSTDSAVFCSQTRYVVHRIRLLAFSDDSLLLKFFSKFFNPFVLALFSIATVAALMITVADRVLLSKNTAPIGGNIISVWVQIIIAIIAIALIHEIGHAAAAYRFGIRRLRIGVAIYLGIPVLYTDLTRAWNATRVERLVMDAAGVYFQSLVTGILGIVSLAIPSSAVMREIVFLSGISILFNITPFMRSDGYWFLCDFFTIPNMRQAAIRRLRELLSFALTKPTRRSRGTRSSKVVTAYIVASAIFAVVATVMLIDSVCASIEDWLGASRNAASGTLTAGGTLEMLNGLYGLILLCMLMVTLMRYFHAAVHSDGRTTKSARSWLLNKRIHKGGER